MDKEISIVILGRSEVTTPESDSGQSEVVPE